MTFTSTTVLLFLVMDPLGNVPPFVSTLALVAPERRRRVLVRELLIALGARGLLALERLMGLLLVALAVQMLLDGLKSYLA